jgi:hypothetical protein
VQQVAFKLTEIQLIGCMALLGATDTGAEADAKHAEPQ